MHTISDIIQTSAGELAQNKNASFLAGIRFLHKDYRHSIAAIYNYVRWVHLVCEKIQKHEQQESLQYILYITHNSLDQHPSGVKIVDDFAHVVVENGIGKHLVDAFLFSKEMDLKKDRFSSYEFNRLVYGLAEVVGLMCLKVIYKDDDLTYKRLMYPARKLGNAFQVVDFLRDLKYDYEKRGKVYFPNVDIANFSREDKRKIEVGIEQSFYEAWHGIMQLKTEAKTGVYLSYLYFVQQLRGIRNSAPDAIVSGSYRVPTWMKTYLAIKAVLDIRLGLVKKAEPLNLKVEIDTKSGFCGGVVKAIKKAEELLDQHGELYCVGEIVHNEEEVRRLEERGLITIDKDQVADLKGKTIMFRAHGEPPKTYTEAQEGNNQLTDATCPIVLRIQDKMKEALDKGEYLFLFGKRSHPETIGLKGHVNENAIVVESLEEMKQMDLPGQISLFSQTTKDPIEFQAIIDYLQSKKVNLTVYNTICKSVSNRKGKLQEFSRAHDKVIFVAGENSSNGKVLFKACKEANPETYFVHSPNNITRKWFKPGESVGICGATSTPKWLMEEVQNIVEAY